jgi:hypothetical protein
MTTLLDPSQDTFASHNVTADPLPTEPPATDSTK